MDNNPAGLQPVRCMPHNGNVRSVVFSPDGHYLATLDRCVDGRGITTKTIRIWDAMYGRELKQITERVDAIIDFNYDGQHLISWRWEFAGRFTVQLWDVLVGRKISEWNFDSSCAFALSSDRRYLATGVKYDDPDSYLSNYVVSEAHLVEIWDIIDQQLVMRLHHESDVECIAFSNNCEYLATSCRGNVHLWNMSSCEVIEQVYHGNNVNRIVFSPSGKFLVVSNRDSSEGDDTIFGATAVYRVANGLETVHWYDHPGGTKHIIFSPDEQYLILDTQVLQIPSWKETMRAKHTGTLNAIALAPTGRHFVTAGDDHFARLWELAFGQEIASMHHDDKVNAAAFSPDGQYIATASDDKTAKIWRI